MESQSDYEPRFNCLLFDLDDTLYPKSSGIAEACRKNIDEFLATRFAFSKDCVSGLRSELYKKYGSSLVGLRARGYEIDADDYNRFVHGRLPYELIQPDPLLKTLLRGMPQRKLVFTNSDKAHAKRVLRKLEIEDCFDKIICFESLNMEYPNNLKDSNYDPKTCPFYIKPSSEAIKRAIELADADPHKSLFFDDNPRNLSEAKKAGLNTVLVGNSERIEAADYSLESIHDVKEAIPEIWGKMRKSRGHEKLVCAINRVNSFEAAPVVA